MGEFVEKQNQELGNENLSPTVSIEDTNSTSPGKEWAPIRAQESRTPTTKAVSLRSLSRTRSQNGYSCDDNDDDDDREVAAGGISEKDPYEVGWDDGDNDPLNPRSKSKAAKWTIVLICSFASLCV